MEHQVADGAAAAPTENPGVVTDEGTAAAPLPLPTAEPAFLHGGEPADAPGEPDADVAEPDVHLAADTSARRIADLPVEADAVLSPEPAHCTPAKREVGSAAAPEPEGESALGAEDGTAAGARWDGRC
ncbi:hypothetical protein ACFZAR_27130 [Streptomyces sp. NPDC008222]|uniref:hypothetical protein n=1 Tax=Streptomyces sp. NPDC008222 TaxID=3364820 RepID=UPI0036DFC219